MDDIARAQPATAPAWAIVVLVDDLRSFRDGRPATVVRNSKDAVELLEDLRFQPIAELWLDHDLGGTDTVAPVVELLQQAAFDGNHFAVDLIVVHTANGAASDWICAGLRRFGYRVTRRPADELISAPIPD